MTIKEIFHEVILPVKYNEDTIENAKKVIENITVFRDFKGVIIKCINYANIIILKEVSQHEPFSKFIKKIQEESDLHDKKIITKYTLKSDDPCIFNIISSMFDIKDTIPEYAKLSDIVYVPNRYDEDFINSKTNVNYLTDTSRNVKHFEEYVTDFRSVYNAGYDLILQEQQKESTYESKKAFKNLLGAFKKNGIKEFNEEDLQTIKNFALDYYYFIENEYNGIIDIIIKTETKPDSKNDCYGILYKYLDRDPTSWETDILWDLI